MPQGFDIDGARKSGASDDDILGYLNKDGKFDAAGALKSGASKQDVISYLAQPRQASQGHLDIPVIPPLRLPGPQDAAGSFINKIGVDPLTAPPPGTQIQAPATFEGRKDYAPGIPPLALPGPKDAAGGVINKFGVQPLTPEPQPDALTSENLGAPVRQVPFGEGIEGFPKRAAEHTLRGIEALTPNPGKGFIDNIKEHPLDAARGLGELIGGGMEAATPGLVTGAMATPVKMATTLGAGMLAQHYTAEGLRHFIAPEYADLISDFTGLIAGYVAHGITAPKSLTDFIGKFSKQETPPEAETSEDPLRDFASSTTGFDPNAGQQAGTPPPGAPPPGSSGAGTPPPPPGTPGGRPLGPEDYAPPSRAARRGAPPDTPIEKLKRMAMDTGSPVEAQYARDILRKKYGVNIPEPAGSKPGTTAEPGKQSTAQSEPPPPPQPTANVDAFTKAHKNWYDQTMKAASTFMKDNPGSTMDQALAAVDGTAGPEPKITDFKPVPPKPEPPPAPEKPPEPIKPTPVQRVSAETPNPPTAAVPTAPESPQTMALQMQQLGSGQRRVVMFPQGQGMPDLSTFPPNVALHHDGLGNTYAYRPDLIKKSAINSAAHGNTLPEVLGGPEGMGAPDKTALQGPPIAVVGKAPDGTEAQTTVTDPQNLDTTIAATHSVTPPGGTVEVQHPEEALAGRTGAPVSPELPAPVETLTPSAEEVVHQPVAEQAHGLPEQPVAPVPLPEPAITAKTKLAGPQWREVFDNSLHQIRALSSPGSAMGPLQEPFLNLLRAAGEIGWDKVRGLPRGVHNATPEKLRAVAEQYADRLGEPEPEPAAPVTPTPPFRELASGAKEHGIDTSQHDTKTIEERKQLAAAIEDAKTPAIDGSQRKPAEVEGSRRKPEKTPAAPTPGDLGSREAPLYTKEGKPVYYTDGKWQSDGKPLDRLEANTVSAQARRNELTTAPVEKPSTEVAPGQPATPESGVPSEREPDTPATTNTAPSATESRTPDGNSAPNPEALATIPSEPHPEPKDEGATQSDSERGSGRARTDVQQPSEAGTRNGPGGRTGTGAVDQPGETNGGRSTGDLTRQTAGGDFRIAPSDHIGEGTPKQKVSQNLDAVRLVKQIEKDQRLATPEEQEKLAKYVGWGGLWQIFDYNKKEFSGAREELRELLTPEEYRAAEASTKNAHYTSPEVITSMWNAMRQFGVTPGFSVLEPSMGVGSFFGLQPDDLMPARRTGVELDKITGAIAKALYPDSNVQITGFEKMSLPNDFFDVSISNVPFGNIPVYDPQYKKNKIAVQSIHNYFFVKALDLTRPGGIVGFITSRYTMEAQDSALRELLASKADLIGMMRLPNTAFKGNAGTQVVTDVIFLQKRPEGQAPSGPAFAQVREVPTDSGPALVNEYYAEHPDMLLGTLSMQGTQYGPNQQTLDGTLTPDILAEAVAKLPKNIYSEWKAESPAFENNDFVQLGDEVKDGGYAIKDGVIVQRDGNIYRPAVTNAKQAQRIRAMIPVKSAMRNVFATQLSDAPEKQIVAARAALNKTYDAFVKEHGPLGNTANARALGDDPDYAPLAGALEDYDRESKTAQKTDIFSKRTIEKPQLPNKADTAAEALAMVLNERGRLDWNRMQELTGKTPDELRDELAGQVFQNPDGRRWETQDEYLSGNVRKKLEMAETAATIDPLYQRNVEALKLVQPKDLTPDEIKITPGAPWIPADVVSDFVHETLGIDGKVHYAPAVATWSIDVPKYQRDRVANSQTFGTENFFAHELFDMALNGKAPRVYQAGPNDTRIFDPKATAVAQAAMDALKDRFREWIWESPERSQMLADKYNKEVNNIRNVDHDGSHLTLPGSNPEITLRPHQKNVIWRALKTGNTLLAHEVGAGKAQPLDAKLLTPSGWIRMGDVAVGDPVISGDGTPTIVEAVFPQGEKDIYRVEFSDGGSTECCDEHLWLTQTNVERSYASKAIAAAKDWDCASPEVRSLATIRTSLTIRRGMKNHSIPIVGRVEFNAQPVALDPYVMGILLGDGTFRATGSILLSCADKDILTEVASRLPAYCVLEYKSKYDYLIRWDRQMQVAVGGPAIPFHPVVGAIKHYALYGKYSHEKHIPKEYLYNSAEVRIGILQGLLDSDGTISKRGTSVEFSTVSKALADGVDHLVRSLGGMTKRRTKTPSFTYNGVRKLGKLAITLTLCLPPEVRPFRLSRKASLVVDKTKYLPARYITNVVFVGRKQAQCIRVAHPSHLYVTDDFAVTHNTWEMVGIAMESRRLGLAKKPMIAVPNHMAEQFTNEFMQLYPAARVLTIGKEDFAADRRKRAVSRIAGGNWDAVIIRHSSFEKIPVSDATYEAFINKQVEELKAALEEQAKEVGKDAKKDKTVKEIQKAISRLEVKLQNHLNREDKDNAVNFEELGVDLLLVDEAHCFPETTLVTTELGDIPIGEIVHNKMDVRVLSCDTETGQLCWARISRWYSNSVSHPLVRVTHENGHFDCTSNHNIWTHERGYVNAGALERETLRALPGSYSPVWTRGCRRSAKNVQSTVLEALPRIADNACLQDLPAMRNRVSVQIDRQEKQRRSHLLQQKVLCALDEFQAGTHQQVQGLDIPLLGSNERDTGTSTLCSNESIEPNEKSRLRREDEKISFGAHVPLARRVWTTHGSTETPGRGTGAGRVHGVSDSDSPSKDNVQVTPELLSGGYSKSTITDGYRSGRTVAQQQEMEVSGSPQDGSVVGSRVVSVALHESGSPYGPEFSDNPDSRVYCLEIEKTHSFFAAGVLVSNSFKSLPIVTRRTRVAGIPTQESNRATDMYMKTQYVSALNGGRRGIIFATGTPVTNTMAELYNMQRYLQPAALKAAGVEHFDGWANMFGDVRRGVELDVSGKGFRENTRFAKFINIPELMAMYRQMADIKTAEMMKLPRPDVEGGGPQAITAPESPELTAYVDHLIDRSEAVRSGQVDKRVDNMLKIVSEGKKAALDMRLVDPAAADRPTSKVNKAVANIYKIWKETTGDRLTQIVFCDLSTPKSSKKKGKAPPAEATGDTDAVPEAAGEAAGFSVYDDMRAKLIREGIPANEIAFIHDYSTDEDKQELFDAVNAGRVRVVFGSTEKMGVGTNVQRRMIALHHMDAPWRPADIKQRDGRIQRQGNLNKTVKIFQYITEGSFDAYSWQLLENKAAFIGPVLSGESSAREMEDIGMILPSAAEFKAMASGNPLIKEKIGTDAELGRLEAQRNGFRRQQAGIRSELARLPERIRGLKESIDNAEIDVNTVEKHKDDGYTIGTTKFTGEDARKQAATALHEALLSWAGPGAPQKLGSYKGLSLQTVPYLEPGRYPGLQIIGHMHYSVNVNPDNPAGTLSSIESTIRNNVGVPRWMTTEYEEAKKKVGQLEPLADRTWPQEKRYQDLVKRKVEIDAKLDESEAEKAAGAEEGDETEKAVPKGTSYQERKRILLAKERGDEVEYPAAETAKRETETAQPKAPGYGKGAGAIATYKPGNGKITQPLHDYWYESEVNGQPYYSDGAFMLEGKAPEGTEKRTADFTKFLKMPEGAKEVEARAFSQYDSNDSKGKKTKRTALWFQPDLGVSQQYYDHVIRAFPNAKFYSEGKAKPITIQSDGKTVGVLMPLTKETVPDALKPLFEPTSQPRTSSFGTTMGGGLGAFQPAYDWAVKAGKQFANEEILPKVAALLNNSRDLMGALVHAVNPKYGVPTKALDTIYKMNGGREAATYLMSVQLDKWSNDINKMTQPEMVDFIDRVKTGKTQPTPELQDLADFIRRTDDALHAAVKQYNPTVDYLENHYRVLWKVIPGSPEAKARMQGGMKGFKGMLGKRPLQGSKGFLKQHVLNDMSEGLALGGVPYSYNPLRMFLAHYTDTMKYITAQRLWEEYGKDGTRVFVRKLDGTAPPDYVKVPDPITKVYFPVKQGLVDAGDWYIQKGSGQLLSNMLSRDYLRTVYDDANAFQRASGHLGRAMLAVKNATTAIELSLSPFHAVFETIEAAGSMVGIGAREFYNLGVRHGNPRMMAHGLATILAAPISPVTTALKGSKARYAAGRMDQLRQTVAGRKWIANNKAAIDDLPYYFMGGGKLTMPEDFRIGAEASFNHYLKSARGGTNSGHYLSAAVRSMPHYMEKMMSPLFERYIPNLKVGFFLKEFALAKQEYADRLASGEMTLMQLARQTVTSIENRFGEMNFDNLYWHRTFKTAAQIATRSVTWKVGNIGANVGALTGQLSEFKRAWQKKESPLLDPRMGWLLGTTLSAYVIGSIIHKYGTGHFPSDMKDVNYPIIDKDANIRVSVPSYWRDLLHLQHDPLGYLTSSMSGEFGKIIELWQNKDFYGNQVVQEDDPIYQKILDGMVHMFPVPFSISSARQAKQQGGSEAAKYAGYLGFTKAPRYIEQSPAELLASEFASKHREVGSRNRFQAQQAQSRSGIRNIYRRGGDPSAQVEDAKRKGLLTDKQVSNLQKNADESALKLTVKNLTMPEALQVYDKASPVERDTIERTVRDKVFAARNKSAQWGDPSSKTRKLALKYFDVEPMESFNAPDNSPYIVNPSALQ